MPYFKLVSLKELNTFGINCTANNFLMVNTERKAVEFFREKDSWEKPLLIIGQGSNLLFTSDFPGTVVRSTITGINIVKKDDEYVIISVGSGTVWDNLVEWTVKNGFYGLENLSYIPGLVGAAPVQNIGAYGVEVKESIVKVSAINTEDGSKKVFQNYECRFGYRNSVFKKELKGKYLITRVYFRLQKTPHFNLEYGSLKEELDKPGGVTLENVRKSVIKIRKSKLPEPSVLGNAGSFFRNPVVTSDFAGNLLRDHPDMPVYKDAAGGRKIAAGWLIEQCGWKGKRIGNAGIHDKQALVLVNYGKASGWDIYKLSEKIRESVQKKFGIDLEREVEIVGPI